MINKAKERHAISAIQAVLIGARMFAYSRAEHKEIAHVLDVAEYLASLMLEPADRTDAFRENLIALAARHESFGVAVERFDAPEPNPRH